MAGIRQVSTWLAATICAASALCTPTAHAFTLPAPAPTEETVRQINQQLQPFGVQLPEVDPALAATIDQSLADAHQQLTEAGSKVEQAVQQGIADLEAARTNFTAVTQPVGINAPADFSPNYQWVNDPISSFMALTPGPVLHRVDGSWFNAPDIPAESRAVEAQGKSLYGPGTPVFVGPNNLCTITATGTDAEGRKLAITAGHCGQVGDAVMSADSWRVGATGTVVARGTKYDYAVIELGSNTEVTNTYNGITASKVGNQQAGTVACKQGVATGNTCGVVWMSDVALNPTQICAMRGDSGAPVLQGNTVVGMVDGGMFPDQRLSCSTPLQGALHMPTVTVNFKQIVDDLDARRGVGAGFQLTAAN